MSDFEERLRAADPAATSSYQHPDTNAMISRIMARAPRAGRHVLRSFQLRMAGSVAVAAALTVGGIAALEGASPSLAVFALAAPHSALGVRSPTAKFGTAEIPIPTSCASTRSSTSVWDRPQYTRHRRGLRVTAAHQRLGRRRAHRRDLRVSGTPVDTNNDGQDFTVTDSSGDYVDYETYDTVPQWSYSVAIPQGATLRRRRATARRFPCRVSPP